MDSAELTGWIAWEQYKAAQVPAARPQPQPVMRSLG